jgi:PAS domain S-box-containing protein
MLITDRYQGPMDVDPRRDALSNGDAGREGSGMESNFSRVIDLLPGLVWTALPDGRADFVNRRWCEYTALSFDEACGSGWQGSVHPEDRPALLTRWQSLVASGEPGELEARLRRFDGEYRWFQLRASPIADASGEVVGWCSIATDIEDHKRREEASAARGRRFEQIVDGLPAIIALFTPDGKIAFSNRQMLEYLDETFEQVQAKTSAYNFHPDDRDEMLSRWAAAVQSGEPFDFEARLRRADGAFRWQWMRVFPMRNAAGRIDLWYGLSTDIDDRKWAETLLAGEKRLLSMVAQGDPLVEVLGALCRVVEDAAPGRLCSVLSIDPDGVRFRHGAGPSLPAAYNKVLDGLVMDRYYGPCGMAAKLKRQVIARDVSSDPRWAASPWPALVVSHGLKSCWSTPILSRDDKVIGVFALYQHEPASPSQREFELIRQFTQIAGVAIERAQSEQELRRSNAYLAEAQRLSLTGSFTWNPATDEHYWSAETYRIFEYDPSTEVSLGLVLQHIHPEDRGLVDRVVAQASEGKDFEVEFRAVTASGVTKQIQVLAHRMPGQDDRLEYIGAMLDVTESRRSEEALRRSNAFLAEAQRISLTGSFSWRVATGEIAWSEQVYRMFEYEPATPVTLDLISARVHPEDLPLLDDMFESAVRGVPDFEYEHRLLLPDGSIKHLRLMAHGTPDQGGQMEYIGAVQEVTDRRVSEEALSKVRSELAHMARVTSLGALTASIAHEVNQPLSGIITNANTCLKMLAADPPNVLGAQATARRTVRDGNRAADIIKRLRTLFGKRDPTSEPVDLNEAAREIIALSWSDLQRSRVIVRAELADELPPVVGDRVQLQQVILNLLLNAADAMSGIDDRPRQMVIRTERAESETVSLTVQDVGVGLDAESAEKLFEAFYTTKSEGMGIGLSISRSIIDNHGGRLWARPNDGPGVSFTFSVPCTADGPAPAPEPAQQSAAAGLQPAMVKR